MKSLYVYIERKGIMTFFGSNPRFINRKKVAMEHYDYLCENFENALKESIKEMKSQGFKEVVQLGNKILKASMINS